MPESVQVIIDSITPCLDGGRYPIKREVGDVVTVRTTTFRDGHDRICVDLLWRPTGRKNWTRQPMTCINAGLDQYESSFPCEKPGEIEYTVAGRLDTFGSWHHDTGKKRDAGQNLKSELVEGLALLDAAAVRAMPEVRAVIERFAAEARKTSDPVRLAGLLLGDEVRQAVAAAPELDAEVTIDPPLRVRVDRVRARYGTWYEMFPRSAGTDPNKSATFKDVETRLPEIAEMGFDVLYFPPIHPIGHTHKKGPNNSLVAKPEDPGCPYSIGNKTGGHDAIEPGLGTLSDFAHLVKEAEKYGLEIALDFALNCSPDHPYLKEHPEWFKKRPDGTIKYAENPPKKYEDIYPLDLVCAARESLWKELRRIILFWAEHGVRIIRVDNPHTKPFSFWEWLISEVQSRFPDMIFLAEAFTRPPIMKALAKLGFTQSYTYFTWRNTKPELEEYFTELTSAPMADYYRGNLFANTPDINPYYLQTGGPAAFRVRAVLATTLTPTYGIYSGFELCEARAVPNKEEYLDSEKYQYKVWDWDRPGNIKPLITQLNKIRKANVALQEYDNLQFHHADNPHIICYSKVSADRSNRLVVVVNLDPHHRHNSFVYLPLARFGLEPNAGFTVHDLLTGSFYRWQGERNYVELDPALPAHVFRIGN